MNNETGRTVMIVDDESFFRELLRDILKKEGITIVAEAETGLEAVEKYRSLRPDIIIMDIFMPEKSGIEATQEIISIDGTANVIICSGMGYDDDVAFALQSGAKGVIFKPFFPNEVMDVINKVSPKA